MKFGINKIEKVNKINYLTKNDLELSGLVLACQIFLLATSLYVCASIGVVIKENGKDMIEDVKEDFRAIDALEYYGRSRCLMPVVLDDDDEPV